MHTANTLSLCPDLVIIEIWGVVHFLSSNSLLFPSYIFLFLIRSLGLRFNIRSDEFPARPLLMEVIDVILVTESWVINNEIFNLSKRNNGKSCNNSWDGKTALRIFLGGIILDVNRERRK